MDGAMRNISHVTTMATEYNATLVFDTIETPDDVIVGWPTMDAVDRFTTPVWYMIGIPGNLLAYAVWIQRTMRPSSGCYLAALALDECIFLVLQMFYELETRWKVTLLQLPGLCEAFPVFFLTTQYLSPLLVLGFTAERYISVCHPFERERYCTTRRAVGTIVGLVVLSLGLHAVQGYFWKYYPAVNVTQSTSQWGGGECRIRPEVMVAGMASIWSVWSWVTEMAVFGVVPLAILCLNILVIRETRHLSSTDVRRSAMAVKSTPLSVIQKTLSRHQLQSSVRPCLSNSSTGSCSAATTTHHAATVRPSATTVMLLAVSFYLIATTLPVTICYVMYFSFPEGSASILPTERWADPVWSRHYVYRGVRTVIEEFGMSHYACNFYIYLATGRIFRRELLRLIGRRCQTGWGEQRRADWQTSRPTMCDSRTYGKRATSAASERDNQADDIRVRIARVDTCSGASRPGMMTSSYSTVFAVGDGSGRTTTDTASSPLNGHATGNMTSTPGVVTVELFPELVEHSDLLV